MFSGDPLKLIEDATLNQSVINDNCLVHYIIAIDMIDKFDNLANKKFRIVVHQSAILKIY